MPDPCDYSDKNEFVSDCVSARQHENPSEDVDQSVAACNSIWDNRDCKAMTDKMIYKQGLQSSDDPYEFIMSTDTRDLYGDIVEQDWDLRAFKQNPIALWMHNSAEPIGNWFKVKVVDGRLRGYLEFAQRGTSELIDKLRSLVEQRVLKAVSVGFVPGEYEALDEDNPWEGYRLSKNKLLECSLVTVPANSDALMVAGLGSVARSYLSAAREEPCLLSAHSQLKVRDSGLLVPTRIEEKTTMPEVKVPIGTKIEKKQEHLVALRSKLTELQSGITGEDAIPEQTLAGIDELSDQISAAERELHALRRIEESIALNALPAPKAAGSTSTVPRIETHVPRKKGHYAFSAISCAIKAYGENKAPVDVAKEHFKDDAAVAMVTRAATAPATMTDAEWAGPLVRETWGEFIELIRDMAIYPNLPGTNLEFDRYGKVNLQRNKGRGQLAGGWFDEGDPIPVKQGAYDLVDLEPKSNGVISTFTKKIAMHSMPGIQGLVQDQILEDTAVQLDAYYLDNVARDTKRPAGIQDPTETGAANIYASGGNTVALINADLRKMISQMIAAYAGSTAVWIINPLNILALRMLQDAASGEFVYRDELNTGRLLGYPMIVSQNIPVDLLVLQADRCMAYGNSYAPVIDVSEHATIVFDDTAPEDIVSGGTPTTQPVKSMFQTLSIAVRMHMGLDWRMTRTGGIQVLTGVAW